LLQVFISGVVVTGIVTVDKLISNFMESIKIQKKALLSTTLVKIYCRKQRHWRLHIAGVIVTRGQLIASVVKPGDKHKIMNISMNLKKFKIALILKGQTETDLWRKNLKFKILCQTPFNELDIKFLYAPLNTNSSKKSISVFKFRK
jgi:hypothetical protein